VADVVVGTVDEIAPGERRILPLGRFGIGVFNLGGQFYALNNYCPHAGAPVCAGRVTGTTRSVGEYEVVWEREGEILRCPWHGWEFSIPTGKTIVDPTRSIKTYPVRVDDGLVIVEVEGADRG
jgi:nitrite reductase/ring-hydroxylating ferredoxin subunit